MENKKELDSGLDLQIEPMKGSPYNVTRSQGQVTSLMIH